MLNIIKTENKILINNIHYRLYISIRRNHKESQEDFIQRVLKRRNSIRQANMPSKTHVEFEVINKEKRLSNIYVESI